MRKIRTMAFICMVICLVSCKKENHSIRVRNLYTCDIVNVKVGTVEIGDVASGVNSSYYPIETGSFMLVGSPVCGGSLYGSGSISGAGRHRWTLTLNSLGTVSIQEDF